MRLEDADDTRFLLSRDDYANEEQSALVFDLAKGRHLWTARGVDPDDLIDGMAVGHSPENPFDEEEPGTEVVALDAKTGKRKWSFGTADQTARLQSSQGEHSLVVSTSEGTAVLEAATGRELARTWVPVNWCRGYGTPLFVCLGNVADPEQRDGGFAVTIELKEETAVIRELMGTSSTAGFMTTDSLIFAKERGSTPGFLTLDSFGRKVRGGSLPGRPLAVSEQYIVFAGEGLAVEGFAVHRRP